MSMNEESVALHQYLNSVIINIPYGIITLTRELEISMINSRAVYLLGFKDEEPSHFVDTDYEHIFSATEELLVKFKTEILSSKERKFDFNNYSFHNKVLNIKCRTTLYGTLFIIEDYTQQALIEEELQHRADYDTLTNLLNRSQLEKRVEKIRERNSENNLECAVAFMDLDKFKPVNDIAGHKAGDALLQNVAKIMQNAIRDRDTLARVGGDEFVILLENCPLSRAVSIVEKIRKEIDEYNFIWKEHTFSIGISAGIAILSSKQKSVQEAINIADQACLIAKQEGRNRIHIADDNLTENAEYKREVSWINVINKALKDDDFLLYKQEIHDLKSENNIAHYELLLRLKDKEGKILSPAAFMPSAERYELMNKIDKWVVTTAFKSLKEETHYSINLSGQTLSTPDFSEFVIELEKKYKINPKQITFEITETMAIKFLKNTRLMTDTLQKRGYNFSLDDFGTGLSSYEYLKKMPVAYLKIDGFFTKEIVKDKVSYAMVKSINEIGHVMGIKTIAEFVENREILEKLKEIGVDYAQGYHLHKPEALSL